MNTTAVPGGSTAARGAWALLTAETLLRLGFFTIVGIFTTVAQKDFALTQITSNIGFDLFYAASSIFCIFGGLLIDTAHTSVRIIRRAVVPGGLVFFAGLAMVAWSKGWWPAVGLTLAAAGYACIRPAISLLLGDQFTAQEARQRDTFFGWFYVSTNVGAFFGFLLGPYLLGLMGYQALSVGVGLTATLSSLVVWLRQRDIKDRPADGGGAGGEGQATPDFLATAGLITCLAVFWALYNQTHSSVVEQAIAAVKGPSSGLAGWKPAAYQSLNPFFIFILTYIFNWSVFPRFDPGRRGSLSKMQYGMAFVVTIPTICLILAFITKAAWPVSAGWVVGIYFMATVAELFLAIPSYSFFYELSQRRKGVQMGLFYATVGFGSLLSFVYNTSCYAISVAVVSGNPLYFAGLTLVGLIAAVAFPWVSSSVGGPGRANRGNHGQPSGG